MGHHGQIGIGAAALAAALPDPHQPATILLLVGLGALIGTTIGRIRRLSRERTREIAENWGFAGGMLGAVLYLAALLVTVAAAIHWRIGLVSTIAATLALIVGLAGRLAPIGRQAAKSHGDDRSRQPREGEEAMPNLGIARYKDARGVRHEIVVRKTRDGGWQVVDLSVRKSKVIETLTGVDEGGPRPRRPRARSRRRRDGHRR